MIPSSGSLFAQPLTVGTLPTRTFRLRFDTNTIAGTVDEREALRQAIYLIFGTERYRYAIYGWDYGIELEDLIGQPADYAQSEIKRRVTEALTADDRITGVNGFEFTVKGKTIVCACTARTIYGDVKAELEAVI